MRDGVLATRLAALMSAMGIVHGATREVRAAWRAWKDGEVTRAQALAQEALTLRHGSDDARHLLFLTAFVRGDYQGALDHYRVIPSSYPRIRELTDPVIEAFIHLGAIADAAAFARGRKGVPAVVVQRLEAHAHRPLTVDLGEVTTIPFADHPLTELLPAFSIEINGQALTAHIDTGGPCCRGRA